MFIFFTLKCFDFYLPILFVRTYLTAFQQVLMTCRDGIFQERESSGSVMKQAELSFRLTETGSLATTVHMVQYSHTCQKCEVS